MDDVDKVIRLLADESVEKRLAAAIALLFLRQRDAVGLVRFDDIVRAIGGKVEILQKLTQRRVQEASSARERTTNNILGFLTALTIVGLAVGLADGLFGERPDRAGHVALRIGAILVSLILAGQLFRLVRWRTPNDSRRGTAGLSRLTAFARRRESG